MAIVGHVSTLIMNTKLFFEMSVYECGCTLGFLQVGSNIV